MKTDIIAETLNSNLSQYFSSGMTICAYCGKPFLVHYKDMYTYKTHNLKNKIRYTCSYTCYNKLNKFKLNLKIKNNKYNV